MEAQAHTDAVKRLKAAFADGRAAILALLKNAESSDQPNPGSAAPQSPATGAVDPSADEKQLQDGMAAIRSLLQRTAAVLGSAATVIIGALGFTQNIFPIPKNLDGGWTALLISAVIAAVVGSVWLTSIFLTAQRRILIPADESDDDDLGDERSTAVRVRRDHARWEQAESLRDVEWRALRLQRIARSTEDADEAKAAKAEADRLFAFIGVALVRAAATVLEERARKAFRGRPTTIAVVLAAAGIIGVFGLSAYFKGQRDLLSLREQCWKAQKAGVVGACSAFSTAWQAEQQRAAVVKANAESEQAKQAAMKEAGDAFARLSPTQQAAITQAADCEAAIDHLPPSQRPSGDARTRAVATCLVAASVEQSSPGGG